MRVKYFSMLWSRAWKDTWQLVVGFPFASVLLAGAVAGLAIYLQHRPWNEAREAILNLGIGIGCTSIVFLSVFLFHFFLWTPKHLYEDVQTRAQIVQKELDQLTAPRPDFFYEGAGSQITLHFRTDSATLANPIVQIDFLLRFINKAKGTAYNLSSRIYACWINDIPRKAELADSTQPSVGRTRPDEAKSLGFSAQRYTREHSSLSVHLDPSDILLILVEIRFRNTPNFDSPMSENEPIWKMWDPRIPTRLCDATETDVRVAKQAIDALKAEREVQV